jgi:hypothetical protein
MGQVIRFPVEQRLCSKRTGVHPRNGSATILILPVIRIERHGATGKAPRPAAKVLAAPAGSGRAGSATIEGV